MFEIKPVDDAAGTAAAQELFREYGDFLRERVACGDHFDFDRFLGEVARLPDDYAGRGGEVLVGWMHGRAAASIAYRESGEGTESCEIKRLFVRPEFRGQGLARAMVEEVLTRARSRGFARAILDSDTRHMAGALKLYEEVGFREYRREEWLVLMELSLQARF